MNAGIDVVVCVGERMEPLADCTHALTREAGDNFRVVRGDAAWQARQRVVEESEADVIAFVDPDVVVPEGWLDSLRVAWETSPHSVAAVGGPIRADVPDWARGRLGLIDLGEDLQELDPSERTLMGGNLSFWRRCLVGAGGFGAPVDRRDANDWLSEEHEAQRQLGHWGWVVRYAPALGAQRQIDRAHLASRSWRYGLRTGIAGSRGGSLAARQAVRSGAGAAAALARGRRGDAAERASRAAENLGVLAGLRRAKQPGRSAAVVPAPVAPSAHRSTFSSISGPHAGSSVDVVLLYHRFAADGPDPLGLCVDPDRFESHLRVLRDNYNVVPLGSIASTLRDGESGTGRVAITIDDGYLDNVTTGIPMIVEAGLPATLFAATGHIETGRQFFWDEMEALLTGPGARPKRLEFEGQVWTTATDEEREVARAELHALTQPRSAEQIERVLETLRAWAGVDTPDSTRRPDGDAAPSDVRPMTIDELKHLAATPRLEIGAHTRDHVNLGHQPGQEVRAQVERSRDDVAQWTGERPVGFSYPFGIPRHDVSEEARSVVAAAGFGYAVVNQPTAVEAGGNVYAIPRVFAPDVGGPEFHAFLQRVLR